MNVVLFVWNDVGPMLELCLNDAGMTMIHIFKKIKFQPNFKFEPNNGKLV
jgi:hypothetical protein